MLDVIKADQTDWALVVVMMGYMIPMAPAVVVGIVNLTAEYNGLCTVRDRPSIGGFLARLGVSTKHGAEDRDIHYTLTSIKGIQCVLRRIIFSIWFVVSYV